MHDVLTGGVEEVAAKLIVADHFVKGALPLGLQTALLDHSGLQDRRATIVVVFGLAKRIGNQI